MAGHRHKTPTDWARQLLRVVPQWYPQRAIVAVADSGYAALSLLASCAALATPITVITRLRLDAACMKRHHPDGQSSTGDRA